MDDRYVNQVRLLLSVLPDIASEDVGARLTGDVAAFLLSLHDAEPDF